MTLRTIADTLREVTLWVIELSGLLMFIGAMLLLAAIATGTIQ